MSLLGHTKVGFSGRRPPGDPRSETFLGSPPRRTDDVWTLVDVRDSLEGPTPQVQTSRDLTLTTHPPFVTNFNRTVPIPIPYPPSGRQRLP